MNSTAQHQQPPHHYRHADDGDDEPHQQQQNALIGCVVERIRNQDVDSTDVETSTCHTGRVVRLRANHTLAIATIDGYYRPMLMKPCLTYWAVYKLD